MPCEKKIEKNLNFSLTFAMGILLSGSTPTTFSYDRYLKIFYLLKLWAFLQRMGGGGGEGLIVKLDNVKACNKECHSAWRIFFVIIYYSPLKTNNRAIFFAM